MIERPDASDHLMEELYDSAIPELLAINFQAVQEAGRMISSRTGNAPDHMELKLTPDFMVDSNGNLTVAPDIQKEIATETLAGLHEALGGSEVIKFVGMGGDILKYWEFVDEDNDSTPWVVVEEHGVHDEARQKGSVSAYLLPGDKRPLTYQKLLNKEIDTYGNELTRTAELVTKENRPSAVDAHTTRTSRIVKALRKVTKPPTHTPSNRWY